MDDWSNVRLCDVASLVLSGVLFFSPWLFDLSTGAQWQTASIAGIVIAVLSIVIVIRIERMIKGNVATVATDAFRKFEF